MHRTLIVAFGALMALTPAYGQADKEYHWCTDTHMQQMDRDVAKMTDAAKKKSATEHLQQSKDAMKKGDTDGCIKHMEAAHKDMGL
jgi:hypothetical protein